MIVPNPTIPDLILLSGITEAIYILWFGLDIFAYLFLIVIWLLLASDAYFRFFRGETA